MKLGGRIVVSVAVLFAAILVYLISTSPGATYTLSGVAYFVGIPTGLAALAVWLFGGFKN